MQELIGKDKDMQSTVMQRNILMAYNKMLANSVEPLLPTLSDHQQEILDNSGYNELTSNSYDVINCAMLLALEYIHAATNYAESHGGGGSPGTGWGRDKDEDDEHWWLRCVAQSTAMLRPAIHKRKRDRQEYVRTGWNSLDERLGGLRNGEIIVVSGYSSMGKTTFVTNLIKNISVEQGLPTLFFSFQLPEHMIARTLLSSMSGLDLNSQLTDEELSHLKSQTERLIQAPIFVNNEELNADLLGSTVAKITRANNIKAIFIDGLRNIFCSQFDTSALKEIFQILKTTAREHNVPIVITDTCKAIGDHDKWNSMPYYPNLDYTSYDPVFDACDVMLLLHRPDYFGIIADDCGRNLQDVLAVGIEKNCQRRKAIVQLKYDFSIKRIYEENESDFRIIPKTEMFED